jgi:hypothetical protein
MRILRIIRELFRKPYRTKAQNYYNIEQDERFFWFKWYRILWLDFNLKWKTMKIKKLPLSAFKVTRRHSNYNWDKLEQDIKKQGVVMPIHLCKSSNIKHTITGYCDDGLRIIDGLHRIAAAKKVLPSDYKVLCFVFPKIELKPSVDGKDTQWWVRKDCICVDD